MRGAGNVCAVTNEAIPVLRVENASDAVRWYERLGYAKEWEHHFDPTLPAFVCIARDGAARLFLSEHRGDAPPSALVYLRVADIEAVAREFAAEIVDQPWAREVHLTDPGGNRLRVGTPRS
jgi:hypothetical protein